MKRRLAEYFGDVYTEYHGNEIGEEIMKHVLNCPMPPFDPDSDSPTDYIKAMGGVIKR